MNFFTSYSTNSKAPIVLLLFGILAILWIIFGPLLFDPNQNMMMVGGDGGMIYFNMIYYILYGDDLYLRSMNYLDPESLFLTDAQGAISFVLRQLKYFFPSLVDYIPGTIHLIFMAGIAIHFFLLYFIIRKLPCPPYLAAVLAICVGTLSPQLVRISYGHFGLAYPFLIPLAIAWLWSDPLVKGYKMFTIGFAVVILFFGINNPYTLLIVVGLLVAYSIVSFIWHRKLDSLTPLIVGLVLVASLYLIIELVNPYDDRIGSQWGYYYYSSTIKGLLYDEHSLLFKIINSLVELKPGRIETFATLSIASLIIIIIGVFRGRYLKANETKSIAQQKVLKLVLASGLLFIYSSALFKTRIWGEIIENIGPLSTFKSSGRMSWVVYYALSLLGVYFFTKLWKSFNTIKVRSVLTLLLCFWLFEGFVYLDNHVKVSTYSNLYNKESLEELVGPMQEVVNFSDYQALMTIPAIQSWMDNLLVEGDWNTEIHAQSITVATGLPWINSRLSRAPVGRSLENVQLLAHPLIYKTLPERLDQSRPVLLLRGIHRPVLSRGESDIISRSKLLYKSDKVELYSIMPGAFNNELIWEEIVKRCQQGKEWSWRVNFNDQKNECGFNSNGGFLLSNEWQEITQISIPDTVSGEFELSFWNHVNIEKYGMPVYYVTVMDKEGNELSKTYLDSRDFIDNQMGWIRSSLNISVSPAYKIVLSGQGRYPMCMDEILFRPLNNDPVCSTWNTGSVNINNYFKNRKH